jgi:hypothetical protein
MITEVSRFNQFPSQEQIPKWQKLENYCCFALGVRMAHLPHFQNFTQKLWPGPVALAFQARPKPWSGCDFGLAWPSPWLEARLCTSLSSIRPFQKTTLLSSSAIFKQISLILILKYGLR